jgi:hypothetical protein
MGIPECCLGSERNLEGILVALTSIEYNTYVVHFTTHMLSTMEELPHCCPNSKNKFRLVRRLILTGGLSRNKRPD